jgi:DNA-binding transcriptional MerR regulator
MAESRAESLPSKLYFRIGEVADLVGVEPHVLRYWEREFRTIRPTKSAKGQRVYSRRDVENLMRVRELLYREGFTIAGAKKKLLHPEAVEMTTDAPPVDAVVDSSARTRDQLLAMRGEIEAFLADLGPRAR